MSSPIKPIKYFNSTCGLDGKPCHGENPITDDSPSAINTPDVAMAGVARHHDRFMSQVREGGERGEKERGGGER